MTLDEKGVEDKGKNVRIPAANMKPVAANPAVSAVVLNSTETQTQILRLDDAQIQCSILSSDSVNTDSQSHPLRRDVEEARQDANRAREALGEAKNSLARSKKNAFSVMQGLQHLSRKHGPYTYIFIANFFDMNI